MSILDQVVTGNALELFEQIPDRSADFVLWDPDYGVGIDYGNGVQTQAQALAFVETLLPRLKAKCRSGQAVVFWAGSLDGIRAFVNSGVDAIWKLHYLGIWHKPNNAPASGNGINRGFEAWFWLKDGPKPEAEWGMISDVLSESRIISSFHEAAGHPSQKPEKLCERLIRFFTLPGQVVLDPTAGSGSALVAARRCGRRYIGFEINPTYAQIARRRLAKTQPQTTFSHLIFTQGNLFAEGNP